MLGRFMIALLAGVVALAHFPEWPVTKVHAQLNNFNSGSTGADGAFSAPSTPASQTVQVPESGVFNYTTFNIPAGVTITYLRNSKNTPVTILASGDVTIAGTIKLDGKPGNRNAGGQGGPGGSNGGPGGVGFGDFAGTAGDGPGGGAGGGSVNGSNFGAGGGGGFAAAGTGGGGQNAGAGGPRYGSATLLPLAGGSGGGGGGGGGGAILIASSGTITLVDTGGITVVGGNGSSTVFDSSGGGGGGSGGAIRLVANRIVGSPFLSVSGGEGGFGNSQTVNGGRSSVGYIRVESFDHTSFNPVLGGAAISFALPNPATIANAPGLRIASVGGVSAPSLPLGSLQGAPDVVVPTTQPNPVNVVIQATNIPVGTVVQVTLIQSSGTRTTTQSGGLAGTAASSSATASVTLPPGQSLLIATATIDLTTASARPMFIDGERVRQIEIAAVYGGASELTYITQSGRRIKNAER